MQENIRNFCIIAHIDSGKSTLADRFLELTSTIEKRKMKEQFLDTMPLERERGITIKMQPVRMEWQGYILNLIDTPGHVDFTYEVSRALAAVEGAVLLVDATKGVQAQTLANLKLAQEQGLAIVPAVNKIDSPLAKTDEVVEEVAKLVGCDAKDVFRISAKEGIGVQELLEEVISKVPAPRGDNNAPLRALIFDSDYDAFKGIVAFLRVVDGNLKTNERMSFLATKAQSTAKEVGYFTPQETAKDVLKAGEIGYLATGIKESEEVRIGDTVSVQKEGVLPLEGYQEPKPMVFVSLYPQDINDFDALKAALSHLKLNDPSFTFEAESKEVLGRGFSCGFLGVLHSEIIAERIQREFALELVISRPSVKFEVMVEHGGMKEVKTATDWPDKEKVTSVKEPWATVDIIVPRDYYSQVSQLLLSLGALSRSVEDLGEDRLQLQYELPLRGVIADLYDKLKSVSAGMASMDYDVIDMRPGDLIKLEIWTAGENQDALAVIVPRKEAYAQGKAIVEKLKNILPPQMFEVALQAVADGKIISRETLKAQRRDVTGALYGGDVTRKKKLLERQKQGKKELKAKGRVTIPSKVFLDLFRT